MAGLRECVGLGCTLEPAGGRWLAVRQGLRTVRGLWGGRTAGDAAFPLPAGRGDEARRGGGPDARDGPALGARGLRDIYVPELIEPAATPIRVSTRDFR